MQAIEQVNEFSPAETPRVFNLNDILKGNRQVAEEGNADAQYDLYYRYATGSFVART